MEKYNINFINKEYKSITKLIEKSNRTLNQKSLIDFIRKIKHTENVRMAINKDPASTVVSFCSHVAITALFLDINECDYYDLFYNRDKKTAEMFENQLGIKSNAKLQSLLVKAFHNKTPYFHGTTNESGKKLETSSTLPFYPLDEMMEMDKIFQKYNHYRIFEGGLKDASIERFYVTKSFQTSSFYAFQSPEFFNRAISRSDYYYPDPYKYDRLAFYSKNEHKCKSNLYKFIKYIKMSRVDCKKVLELYTIISNGRFNKKDNPVVYMMLTNEECIKTDYSNVNDFSPSLVYHNFFKNLHYPSYYKCFHNAFSYKISYPNCNSFFATKQPISKKLFICQDNKKYIVDLYAYHNNFFPKTSYIFNNNTTIENCKNIDSTYDNKNKNEYIEILANYFSNTKSGKIFLNLMSFHITFDDVKEHYRQKLIDALDSLSNMDNNYKSITITNLSLNYGVKYVAMLKYNKLPKDIHISQIHICSRALGRSFYQSYELTNIFDTDYYNSILDSYNMLIDDPKAISKFVPSI